MAVLLAILGTAMAIGAGCLISYAKKGEQQTLGGIVALMALVLLALAALVRVAGAHDQHRRPEITDWMKDVPDSALIDGPNKAGDALLWMNKGWLGISVRCFKPGSET